MAIDAVGVACNWNVLDTPFRAAVIVTAWAVVALLTLTWKFALVDPAGTVTDVGADTEALADDVLMLTAAPPAGAAPLRDTVHAEEAGTVSEDGAHVRLERDAAGVLPVMLTLAAPAATEIEEPSGPAAAAFVTWTLAVWLAADEDTVKLTTATVPVWIWRTSLVPVRRHVFEPVPATQSNVLPADEPAAPTAMLIPLNAEVGYDTVHCNPAGPPLVGAVSVSGRLTVEPAVADPFESPSVTPCPSTTAGSSINRTSDFI